MMAGVGAFLFAASAREAWRRGPGLSPSRERHSQQSTYCSTLGVEKDESMGSEADPLSTVGLGRCNST